LHSSIGKTWQFSSIKNTKLYLPFITQRAMKTYGGVKV